MRSNPMDTNRSFDALLRRRLNFGWFIVVIAVVVWAWNVYRVFG